MNDHRDVTLSNSDDDSFRELAVRYLADELNVAELTEFDKLLAESPELCGQLSLFAWQARLLSTRLAPEISAADTAIVLKSLTISESTRRRFVVSHRAWAWAASLLLVGYFGALVGLLAWDRFHKRDQFATKPTADASPASLVAISTDIDAKWDDPDQPLVGDTLKLGEHRLRQGSLKLAFDSGAAVIIEAPAVFEVQSRSAMKLDFGKLSATVPPPAIGFMVETPTTKVIDLGTEFGVEVGESGATDVHVSKGKVELRPSPYTKNASTLTPVTLSAGSARRIEFAGPNHEFTIREIDTQSTPLPHRLGAATFPIKVRGARANSEFPFRGAHNLINGSGLHAGEHDGQRLDTMWLTDGEHKQGNHVIFDLGHRYRVEKMKVWNYNERAMGVFHSRGVKQADIYISDSGKWDPLARPEEWKLVIAGQEFSAADGTDHYATPDVIDLGNAEARFVAILIHERLADDSSQPDSYYVGLSEVQFFGERILAPPRANK